MKRYNYIIKYYYPPKKDSIRANSLQEAKRISKKSKHYKDTVYVSVLPTWDIKIDQLDKENNFLKTWDGIKTIAKAGFTVDGIKKCLIGGIKMSRGYKWKYHEFNK